MLSLSFSPFPLLETERLLLRRTELSDVNEVFFLRSDSRVMKYIDKEPAKDLNEVKDFIKKLHELEKSGDGIYWAIDVKNKQIGSICFWNIQHTHDRAEIGYALHPDYHGKGIMQEAIHAVLQYGFSIMKLHSIEANVNPANEASIKILERNHFIREGYFKENFYYNGRYLDSAIYFLLKTRYRRPTAD